MLPTPDALARPLRRSVLHFREDRVRLLHHVRRQGGVVVIRRNVTPVAALVGYETVAFLGWIADEPTLAGMVDGVEELEADAWSGQLVPGTAITSTDLTRFSARWLAPVVGETCRPVMWHRQPAAVIVPLRALKRLQACARQPEVWGCLRAAWRADRADMPTGLSLKMVG